MSGLVVLILNVSFSDYFHALPNALGVKEMFLFFGAMARESIEYVAVVFQNISIKIF